MGILPSEIIAKIIQKLIKSKVFFGSAQSSLTSLLYSKYFVLVANELPYNGHSERWNCYFELLAELKLIKLQIYQNEMDQTKLNHGPMAGKFH